MILGSMDTRNSSQMESDKPTTSNPGPVRPGISPTGFLRDRTREQCGVPTNVGGGTRNSFRNLQVRNGHLSRLFDSQVLKMGGKNPLMVIMTNG